ncbi:MAG: Appr-1-p processing protein [Bacteroidales bacterium]|nr:Appr-1-p processing protein [Bacteroidales bacterium]
MKINYLIGDATNPVGSGIKIICHICNDANKWGAGFVIAISKKWKAPEESYRSMSADERILGHVRVVQVEDDIVVANMIGQHGVGLDKNGNPPIRYAAVREALMSVDILANVVGATLHMPRIGCGLAGGRWEEIEKIIHEVITVDTYVYDLK